MSDLTERAWFWPAVIAGFIVVGILAIVGATKEDNPPEVTAEQFDRAKRENEAAHAALPPTAIDAPPPTPAPSSQERAEQALRGRVHLQRLSKAMHDRGIDETFEVGETDEDVVWRGGLCTERTLKDLARRFSSSFHSEFGFKRMWCLGMSESLE